MLPERNLPFREVTINYHESQDVVQAFPYFMYSSNSQNAVACVNTRAATSTASVRQRSEAGASLTSRSRRPARTRSRSPTPSG